MNDPYHLDRFVEAQQGIYAVALREVRAGAKRSHWMWFIFPQSAGLGHSDMARRYAISGTDEAHAYLAHPVLGPRLREITSALSTVSPPDPVAVFGPVDAMKLRSCLTLFAGVEPAGPFRAALARWFGPSAVTEK